SGLGALLLPFMGGIPDKTSPVDLWLVDSNTLWSLLWNPLFPYSLTTILMAVLWFDRGAQGEGGQRPLWLSGAALGLLALIHPYTVPLLYALLGMIAAIRLRWKAPHALFPVLVASAPALVYVAGLSLFNPLVRLHSLTGEMQSPSITLYVLGFGLPLLTAIFGTFVFWKAMSERLWPLLLWVYLAIFLAYCPLWFSDKLIFGLHAPICILAAVSFDLAALRKLDGRPPWTRAAAVAALLLAVAPTQLRLFIRTPGELARNAEARYRIPDDLLAGMEYLRKNSAPSDLVFAPIGVSNQLPAYSGNTVVWGHWAQSVDLKLREKWYMDVFGADSLLSEQERGRAFWSFGIRYVFASGDLKDWLDAHHPAWISARATKVFENPAVTIFRRNGA
ncbi:MAG TPA: hypothetical protein VNI01_10300, partial [Elusimicrobiota bacterium]|nr:hypothetical protein [Elusimicrobiota bacterium]